MAITPGPWEIRRQSNTVAQVGGPVVCDLNGVAGGDAALIAAAPELYGVLSEIIYWPSVRAAIGDSLVSAAESALAKASAVQVSA